MKRARPSFSEFLCTSFIVWVDADYDRTCNGYKGFFFVSVVITLKLNLSMLRALYWVHTVFPLLRQIQEQRDWERSIRRMSMKFGIRLYIKGCVCVCVCFANLRKVVKTFQNWEQRYLIQNTQVINTCKFHFKHIWHFRKELAKILYFLSICVSVACKNLWIWWQVFIKVDSGKCYRSLTARYNFDYKRTWITGTLHECLNAFLHAFGA